MDIQLFSCLCVVVGICITIYIYASSFDDMGTPELCTFDIAKLYIIRTLHFSIFVFFLFYSFLADISIRNDIIVIFIIVLITLQWYMIGGCILTFMEERILFPERTHSTFNIPFLTLVNMPSYITDIPDETIWCLVVVLGARIMFANQLREVATYTKTYPYTYIHA